MAGTKFLTSTRKSFSEKYFFWSDVVGNSDVEYTIPNNLKSLSQSEILIEPLTLKEVFDMSKELIESKDGDVSQTSSSFKEQEKSETNTNKINIFLLIFFCENNKILYVCKVMYHLYHHLKCNTL